MIYFEVLKNSENYLREHGIEDARTDAWLLLEHVTGITRTAYLLKSREEMPMEQYDVYQNCLEQRAQRIPLQHITGTQEFMGLTFQVNEHVLIPRQDTETLVENVLENLPPAAKVLDMCTGSGCIAISLAHFAKGISMTAADISEEALKVARANADRHQVSIEFIQGNLFENISETYDVIVSNPPYICTKEIETLSQEVRCHEPFIALDGLEDGLHFYRQIIQASHSHLKENGQIWFEIGYDQGISVPQILKKNGFSNIRVIKDLTGLDRVVNAVKINI